jgi:hypothetical protein
LAFIGVSISILNLAPALRSTFRELSDYRKLTEGVYHLALAMELPLAKLTIVI